jgi:hypothetical protein
MRQRDIVAMLAAAARGPQALYPGPPGTAAIGGTTERLSAWLAVVAPIAINQNNLD